VSLRQPRKAKGQHAKFGAKGEVNGRKISKVGVKSREVTQRKIITLKNPIPKSKIGSIQNPGLHHKKAFVARSLQDQPNRLACKRCRGGGFSKGEEETYSRSRGSVLRRLPANQPMGKKTRRKAGTHCQGRRAMTPNNGGRKENIRSQISGCPSFARKRGWWEHLGKVKKGEGGKGKKKRLL